MKVGAVCTRDVVTVSRGTGLLDVARTMRDRHVGNLVVVEEKEGKLCPVGVVTDRDIVISVVARDLDYFNSLTVGDVMSFELVTAREDEHLEDVLKRMRMRGVRRVPIVKEDGTLAGILAFDDIVCLLTGQMVDLATLICHEQLREEMEKD